jgi:hypothetical protein
MSIFLIPSSVIDDIEKMLNSFWWVHNRAQSKGIRWMSWERLSVHKQDGGMGFKSLGAFNHAMLGKQAWNLITKPDTLVAKLFKAKYFPHSDFLESSIGHNPSYVWRRIWSSKFVVKGGHKWSIGTGHNISLWDQNWLFDGTSIKKPDNIDSQLNNLTVADLLHHNVKEWVSGLIRGLVNDDIADKILHTPLLESVQNDKITWQHEKNGLYTVKSAYRFCISTNPGRDQHRVEGKWHLIWQTQMPPKIKKFMWRICRNCLPTRARLHDRGVTCPINCVLCDAGDEDSNHLFFSCQNSINCWQQMGLWSSIMQHRNLTISVKENVFNIMLQLNEDSRAVFACVMWSIWKQRNDVIWRNERVHRTVVCERANSLLTCWRNAREVRDRYNNQQHSPQR